MSVGARPRGAPPGRADCSAPDINPATSELTGAADRGQLLKSFSFAQIIIGVGAKHGSSRRAE